MGNPPPTGAPTPRQSPDSKSRPASNSKRQAEVLRVLQITDTHLYANRHGRLLGQSTRQTLDLVLDLALRTRGYPDLILVTGDLVQDASPEGYSYLKQRLTALNTPCYCLPGNHDNASVMSRILEGNPVNAITTLPGGTWNLVLLDSTTPGEEGGHLDAEQLERLEDSLATRPKHPALVCLHHQPVPVGSAWLDSIGLDNPEDFFGIIDRHPQIRGILWGHIHQEFSGHRNGACLLASPSTCVQFLPDSEDFALDTRTPGFRWLELHDDGHIDTGVERIASYPDPLVVHNCGY